MPTITKPITVTKVRNALGVRSTDVGTLCTHANVRHWARFKPMDMPGIAQDKRDASDYLRLTNYWKGKCSIRVLVNGDYYDKWGWTFRGQLYEIVSCGIKFYAYTNTNDLMNIYYGIGASDIQENFSWDKPKGGANSPFRLGDFIGYDNHAGCQFWSDTTKYPFSDALPTYVNGKVTCTLTTFDIGGGYNGLSIKDLLNFATDIQFCVVTFKEDISLNSGTVVNEYVQDISADDYTTVIQFTPNETTEAPRGGTLAIGYLVKFKVDNGNTTLYMPITQSAEGGNNTTVVQPNDGYHYGLKRYKVIEEKETVAYMNLEAVRSYVRSTTAWNEVADVTVGNPYLMTSVDLQMRFNLKGYAKRPFTLDARCLRMTFKYYDSQDEPNIERQVYIDGSSDRNTNYERVKLSDSDVWNDNKQIAVTTDNAMTIYVSMPGALDAVNTGKVINSRSKITYVVIEWRRGTGEDWVPMGTYNLNMLTN